MIWKIITGGITSMVESGFEYFTTKQKAKTAVQQQVIQGKIDYNALAQKGMVGTLKDEFLVLWFTVIMSLNFYPPAQPYMERGWKFMNANTPGWFSYCFIGIVVATFGLKGWAGWKANGGGNVQED
jgi:hypothetical protein